MNLYFSQSCHLAIIVTDRWATSFYTNGSEPIETQALRYLDVLSRQDRPHGLCKRHGELMSTKLDDYPPKQKQQIKNEEAPIPPTRSDPE